MNTQPTLTTPRLSLRPFRTSDAKEVQRLAGEFEVADPLLSVPHPYEDGVAEAWIETHEAGWQEGKLFNSAVVLADREQLIGSIGLVMRPAHDHGELGYWIGRPYWGEGYATEAARAIVAYAFEHIRLNKVYAHHLSRNVASGRVLLKVGMRHEGQQRQHVKRWGVYEDIEVYGILRGEWARA